MGNEARRVLRGGLDCSAPVSAFFTNHDAREYISQNRRPFYPLSCPKKAEDDDFHCREEGDAGARVLRTRGGSSLPKAINRTA